MERRILAQQLRAALTAHDLWRSLLVSAAVTGRARLTVSEARRDDACEFGRWLLKVGELPEVPQVAALRDIHAHFHEEAAEVLVLAFSGRRAQATASVGAGSRFDEASQRLRAALEDWAGAL